METAVVSQSDFRVCLSPFSVNVGNIAQLLSPVSGKC